jgi:hypothetical protein
MDSRDEQALGNTMLRFARAMSIAGRPDLERREYSKKLYKLLTGYRAAETKKPEKGTRYRTDVETEDSQDALELFAKYSTGQITPEELKKNWARQVLDKEQPPKPTEQEYQVYNKDTGETLETVRFARGESEGMVSAAISDAIEKYSGQGINIGLRKTEEPEAEPGPRAKVAQRILEKPIWWVVQADTGNYVKSVMVQARGTEEALKKANQEDPWFAQNERVMRDYGTIRPATQKEIEEHGAVLWHVEDTNTRRVLLIMAKTKEGAHQKARLQDSGFKELAAADPDSFLVIPATADEIQQHREQAADNAQDIEQIQQRVTGNTRFPYRVSWRETVNGREIEDSLNVDAASAEAAVENVRRSLEASGHIVRPGSIRADQAPIPGSTLDRAQQRAQQATSGSRREYHIYSRATDNPVIGFMAADDDEALERLRRYRLEHPDAGDVGVRTGGESMRTQTTPQGEWTGHWIVKDAQGQELTRFHGIGNNQQDANRHAIQWLTRNGYSSGTEVEVVPEMSE